MNETELPDLSGETWSTRELGRFYQEYIVMSGDRDVCHVLGWPQERRQAATALIVAAPNLLQACLAAFEHLAAQREGHEDVLEQLHAAIERAREAPRAEQPAGAEDSR